MAASNQVKFHYDKGSAVMTEGTEGRYRELLLRRLPGDGDTLVFCMLNPSTADHKSDDPTIRRCIGFAMRENARALAVINLYALRSTDPMGLRAFASDVVVGVHNDSVIRDVASKYGRVVCAWGNHASVPRVLTVMRIFREHNVETLCLGKTKGGMPKHPLYIKADQQFEPYEYTGG